MKKDLHKFFSDNGKKGQNVIRKKYSKKEISEMRKKAALLSHSRHKKKLSTG